MYAFEFNSIVFSYLHGYFYIITVTKTTHTVEAALAFPTQVVGSSLSWGFC